MTKPHQRNFERSRELFERASRSLAGGVSSQFRAASPHPLYFERAEGSRMWDADGNEYIDFSLGQGPVLLGHAHPVVMQRANDAAQRGILFAGQHELEVELAEAACRLIPSSERVRFGSVGSEVVQAALRLARAVTGRTKYIKFEGHYHGWFDNVAVSINPDPDQAGPIDSPTPVPWTRGMAPGVFDDVIILPWNNVDVLKSVIERESRQIAAVIAEPVMCNNGCIPPVPGFMETLRELCDDNDIVLIFDEIVTGFRLALGGAQEEFGVKPDLATFAKAMANGYPISMLVGRRELMDYIGSGEVIHAGTYNSNVVATAAAHATIGQLEELGTDGYAALSDLGNHLAQGLRDVAHRTGWQVLVQGPGPMFHMGFTDREAAHDYRATLDYDKGLYGRFAAGMLRRGVRLIGRGIWYVSFAHTPSDVEQALGAAEATLSAMRAGDE